MNCEQYLAQLSRWLEGELTPQEAERMLEHANACTECAGLFRMTRSLLAEAYQMGSEREVPPQVAENWRKRLGARPHSGEGCTP